jgi:hypothetical protein
MKISDDYGAKIKLWAATPRVVPLPPGSAAPKVPPPQRFRNHAEMNRWKSELLRQIAGEMFSHG